jgi:hypothetical protein|eukprot:gene14662-16265_t
MTQTLFYHGQHLQLVLVIIVAIIRVSISQVTVQRIFGIDGFLINETLPETAITTSGKIPIPYDVFQIPSGFFFLNTFIVVAADKNERIIEPSSGQLFFFYTNKDVSRENTQYITYFETKNVTIERNLLFLRENCHYWHFHYETISQLYFYDLAGIFDKYAGQNNSIISPNSCKHDRLTREILKFFGFDKKLDAFGPMLPHSLSRKQGIHTTKNLIISTNTGIAGTVPNLPTVRFIHQKAMENARNNNKFRPKDRSDSSYFHRRIFVDREEGYKRRLTNRHELLQMLAKYDIYDYLPGTNTTYAKQMYLFSHAELVIGPSGTGFSTNIAFCNPNSTVLVEIFPYFPHTGTGIYVSRSLGFKQYYQFKKAYDGEEKTLNFKVNITALDELLFDILSADR